MKTATLTRLLQSSMYVLKMANASRNQPRLSRTSVATLTWPACVVRMNAKESQNPPYVVKAVAPNTLRFLNSHMPAANCASPP